MNNGQLNTFSPLARACEHEASLKSSIYYLTTNWNWKLRNTRKSSYDQLQPKTLTPKDATSNIVLNIIFVRHKKYY